MGGYAEVGKNTEKANRFISKTWDFPMNHFSKFLIRLRLELAELLPLSLRVLDRAFEYIPRKPGRNSSLHGGSA
jgi:hypothetical protein